MQSVHWQILDNCLYRKAAQSATYKQEGIDFFSASWATKIRGRGERMHLSAQYKIYEIKRGALI